MSCNECAMTNKGTLSSGEYAVIACCSLTDLMKEGGQLLSASLTEMIQLRGRVKSKLPGDAVGKFHGPQVKHSLNVPMH